MTQVVGGRYHLIAHLGGGATSDVSLAKTDAKSDVAKLSVVKRLKHGADTEASVVAQFADEARLSLRLIHPNIAQAFEAGEDDGGPFLVLEYLDGQTLARIRSRAQRKSGGIPRAIALHIVMAVATGLAYAHSAVDEAGKPLRIVHRDVSPENIIVTYAGATKIIDFSVAMASAAIKTRAGATKGNIAYMAPEQSKSAVNLDERADVFATGLVLWELLAGKRMWDGLSEADVIARLGSDDPLPTLRSVVPDMPEALDAICTQALAKVRDERFESAVELKDAIEKAMQSLGLRATTREVAEFVTSLFEDERAKMKALVDEAMGAPPASSPSLPRLRPDAPSSSKQFVDVETDPKLWVNAAARAGDSGPNATAVTKVVEVVTVEQAPSPDRRFALLVGGAVLISFAVVAVVALTHDDSGPKNDKSQVSTAARPTASGPDPSVSAWVEPEEVTVEITVRPPTANLFVDGVRATTNPYRAKVVAGKFVHDIRAEAEGFETRTMKLPFDRDRSIEIALTPTKPAFVAQPVPPRKPGAAAGSGSAAPKPPDTAPSDVRDN